MVDCESGVYGAGKRIAATPELCPSEYLACTLRVLQPPRPDCCTHYTALLSSGRTGRAPFSLSGDCAPRELYCTIGCGADRDRAIERLPLCAVHHTMTQSIEGLGIIEARGSPRIPERRRRRYRVRPTTNICKAQERRPTDRARWTFAGRRVDEGPARPCFSSARGLLLCRSCFSLRYRLPTPGCRTSPRMDDRFHVQRRVLEAWESGV